MCLLQVSSRVDSHPFSFEPPPSGFLAPPERRPSQGTAGILPPQNPDGGLAIHTSVALSEDFKDVVALRLDVFTDYPNSLVRRQMEKRALAKMEDRRTKGATCVVARLGRPRGEVCGSLELSWHEFISCDVDAPLEPETVGERSAVVGEPVNDLQRDARTDSRSLAVFRPHGARLYITELCVAPFAQRRGVGLALLRASEDLVYRSYCQPKPALPPGAAVAPANSARDVGMFQRRRDRVADWLKQRVQPRANVGAATEAAFAAPQAAMPAARVARPAEAEAAEAGRGSAATSLLSPALYLHVDGANRGALALYARAGFEVMFDGSTVVERSSPEVSAASASSAVQRAACGRFAQNLGLLSGELAKINHVLMVHAVHVPCA